MPKVIPPEEFDRIVQTIGRFPGGATLDGILAALGHEWPRRTLQRRLADLVAPGTPHRRVGAEVIQVAVCAIVRCGLPATTETVRQSMPASIAPNDREVFSRLVLEEFKTLHAGNAVRFGLRPLELDAWTANARRD